MKFSYSIGLYLSYSSLVASHVAMINPPPRKSKHNPYNNGDIRYDQNSPLVHYAYPCKGYRERTRPVASYRAGQNINVRLEGEGEARHSGGHCEFALSYDNGNNFVVIKTVMGECLRNYGNNYDVQIPYNAPPSEHALFSWTWLNRSGNREFYMNCADIRIENPNGGLLSGPAPVVANMPECVDRAQPALAQGQNPCNLNIGCAYVPEFIFPGSCDGSKLYENRKTLITGSKGLV